MISNTGFLSRKPRYLISTPGGSLFLSIADSGLLNDVLIKAIIAIIIALFLFITFFIVLKFSSYKKLFFKIFYGTIVLSQAKRQIVIENIYWGKKPGRNRRVLIVCDHDVKIYSQINKRKSTSPGYQDNQMLN